MKTYLTFRSDRFPPYDGEEEEVNPNRYGKRLAEFLVAGLKEHGIETGEPLAEDWGWCVVIKNKDFRLWIGCGNEDENPDGFLCFIEPHQATVRKLFRKIDTTARVAALHEAIDQILSEAAGIRDKRWWTHDEFNEISSEQAC